MDSDRGDRALPVEIWYPVDPEDAGGTQTFYELLNFGGLAMRSIWMRSRRIGTDGIRIGHWA